MIAQYLLSILFFTLFQPLVSGVNYNTHFIQINVTYIIVNNGDVEVNALDLRLVSALINPPSVEILDDTQVVSGWTVFINGTEFGRELDNGFFIKPRDALNITLIIRGEVDLNKRGEFVKEFKTGGHSPKESLVQNDLTLVKPMWNYTHPIVSLLSKHLWGKASDADPVNELKIVLDYFNKNIIYSTSVIPRYPWEVVVEGMGDCDDQSNLLVTLLRSMNTPSLIEYGFVYVSDGYSLKTGIRGFNVEYHFKGGFSHAWVLAFIENVGWVRVDPTSRLMGGDNAWVMVEHAYYYRFPTLVLDRMGGEDHVYTWFTSLNELNFKKLRLNSTVTILHYAYSSSDSS